MAWEGRAAVERSLEQAAYRGPDNLLAALARLDRLLERALELAAIWYGPQTPAETYRGLYINQEEVRRLLARPPALPLFRPESPEAASENDASSFSQLHREFNLSDFDLDVVVIALAPELDLRYERLYAYLQDDVTRKRPTVDLALNLLCATPGEKIARRSHFASGSPLVHAGLVHLIPDPHQVQPPLLAQVLKLDDQVVRFLLGGQGLDQRLTPYCHLFPPDPTADGLAWSPKELESLPVLMDRARNVRQPLCLYFHGPRGAGKRRAAHAVAGRSGRPLLLADLSLTSGDKPDLRSLSQLLIREARFQNALLYLEGLAAPDNEQPSPLPEDLASALAEFGEIAILAGTQPWVPVGDKPLGVLAVAFPIPNLRQRRECWEVHLAKAGISLDRLDLESLAKRYRLTPGQIAEAAAGAGNLLVWRALAPSPTGEDSQMQDHVGLELISAAARAQTSHYLAKLAQRLVPLHTWDDLVLPQESLEHLREISQWVAQRHRVMAEWGFEGKLSHGKGVNVLFSGPPGTGKTLAAEIIARELGLDLYKIDLSGVVSKYIGETEKNLARLFAAAENSNAILFFDEAEALFGKRTEVRDSHDRYANIEISYLLQKMEEYQGLAILATNLYQNLDEAFTRRLAFIVNFPFPDEVSRRRIWAKIWPDALPLAPDVNLDLLAQRFKLSGGNIKNTALAAAFLAAADGGRVRMAHLVQAVWREYQKMGQVMPEGAPGEG
jgi:AAA+ superfamily predicted ATPase